MRVAHLGFLAGLVGSLALGCGGGGAGPNPPPPPPPPAPGNLVKQAGDNQNGNVGEPVPVPPSVKVTSTAGAPISGVAVTFAVASGGGSVTGANPTTGSDGVATVGSWTLGPAAGANTLTATISGSGVVGNPATFTATGALTAFNPTANTTLSGNVSYASVNIPAGVTVTVSNDAVITVTGAYTQAGTLLAPCHALTLVVDGAVTVTGNVSNQCAVPTANAPDLRIVGKISYSFSNGTIATSGDLSIVNDPTEGLSLASAMTPARFRMPDPRLASVTIGRCNFDNETIDIGDAPDGTTASPNGAAGSSAFLGCGFLFSGNTGGTVTMNSVTINGADGGDGLADVKSNAAATGGNGGPPGPVFVSADEDIELSGSITINGGDGGDGGSATSTGTDGNPGNSATATGGNGGGLDPGEDPVRFEAGGAITQIGSLAVVIGTAGSGGSATATGGNGVAATPGAPGGSQTATGGNGGNGMNVRMNASGAVSLGGSVTISGGAAGAGGAVTCLGGNGGDGVGPGAPGGPAGAKNCRGGNGGQGGTASLRTANVRVDENPLALNPATPGGDAGPAAFGGGRGGNGAPNCPAGPGGTGGKGSDISGGDGSRGIGNPNGAGANATVTNAANGGDGAAPGAPGGGAGANNLTHGAGGAGPFNIVNSFNPGPPGGPCPPQISLTSASPNNPTIQQGSSSTLSFLLGRVNYTGNVLVELLDQNGNVRGSTTVPGPAGNSGSIGFTVPGSEPLGPRNWSLRASGTGVSTVTLAYPINVTAPAGTQNVIIQNGEQATRPYTKVITKSGSGAFVSHPIAGDGTVIVPVPLVTQPHDIVIQQRVGNDRRTIVIRSSTTDFLTFGAAAASQKARGNVSALVSNLPNNTQGLAFGGSVEGFFPQPNSSPMTIPMTRVETGIDVANGCTAWSGGNPNTAILRANPLSDGGNVPCDFGAGGVKNYLTNPITVNGVSAGTTLQVTGGFQLGDLQTTVYNRSFMAPATTKYALNGADLPANVLNYASVARAASGMFEQAYYYFTNPGAWTVTLPPPFNNPTVSLTNLFNGYYNLDVSIVTQSSYSSAWVVQYFHPNSFGGNNEVAIWTLASYLGGSVPGTLHVNTPTDLLLDPTYMPGPPGHPTGIVGGFGFNPLMAPGPGETRIYAGRSVTF